MEKQIKNEWKKLSKKLTDETKKFFKDDEKYENKLIKEDIKKIIEDMATGNLSKENLEISCNTIAMLGEISDTKATNNFFQSCWQIIKDTSHIVLMIVLKGVI